MSLVGLHDGWLRSLLKQGVFITAAALADADAYPTEPVDGLRAVLSASVGSDGALLHRAVLLLDPAALGWPKENLIFRWPPELAQTAAAAPETPALKPLAILHDEEIKVEAGEIRSRRLVIAIEVGDDLDTPVAAAGSATQQAEALSRALHIPLAILLGAREIRLVHAPTGAPSAWLSFPIAQLLAEDGILLGALDMLIGHRRLLSLPEDKRLLTLIGASRATRLRSLTLENFGVFAHAELDFCPGINVIIGPNGAGKTHAMKALYALLRVQSEANEPEKNSARAEQKLAAVLRPDGDDLGRLVRWGAESATITVGVENGGPASLQFDTQHHATLEADEAWRGPVSAMYLPTREILALYEWLVPIYQTRQIAIDETLYDACRALEAPLLRSMPEALYPVLKQLQEIAGGPVVLRGNRFYVQRGDRLVEAQLLAEGIRKLAGVAKLVANGSIASFGALIWDEPEGNLNPMLVVRVADLLVELAAQRVQVIVASHDYLFVRRLSLLAEYKKRPDVPIRFFGLCPTTNRVDKDTKQPLPDTVEVETGDVLADLAHNPILDEFTRQADFEQQLFYESPEP